jgi:hypothetical protein
MDLLSEPAQQRVLQDAPLGLGEQQLLVPAGRGDPIGAKPCSSATRTMITSSSVCHSGR